MLSVGSGALATKTVLTIEDDSNGREALDWLAAQPILPSLVLLDWMMPVLDGMGFLNFQASDPRLATIPVVVVSAVARMARIPRLCVAAVVAKPVRLRTLVEIVDRICGLPPRDGGGGEPAQWERTVGKRAPTDPGMSASDDATACLPAAAAA